jgi:hypothetical protein
VRYDNAFVEKIIEERAMALHQVGFSSATRMRHGR